MKRRTQTAPHANAKHILEDFNPALKPREAENQEGAERRRSWV